ncbi:SigB/SigF/SigG family RNA polymerase sigma factor [Marinactinospora thermotolerans]|nr:SigB/SigF/SigG family RNA polymerase sigma factor [Marinactinospora thermotolerans]
MTGALAPPSRSASKPLGGGDGASCPPLPRDADAEHLLRLLPGLPPSSPVRDEVRRRIARMYAGRVQRLADRYRNRGEPTEDLRQVAMVGLMKAIDGFDPDYGRPFPSYLVPVVSGELKRHFRDNTWAVRVPRRHQERRNELNRVVLERTQALGRSPTISEIAAAMDLDLDGAVELINASSAYSALSLDAPCKSAEEDEDTSLGETLGGLDRALENVVDREALKVALRRVPPRERRVLYLRFFADHTQTEIAAMIGVSQMQVSRLLARTLRTLREELMSDSVTGSGTDASQVSSSDRPDATSHSR